MAGFQRNFIAEDSKYAPFQSDIHWINILKRAAHLDTMIHSGLNTKLPEIARMLGNCSSEPSQEMPKAWIGKELTLEIFPKDTSLFKSKQC